MLIPPAGSANEDLSTVALLTARSLPATETKNQLLIKPEACLVPTVTERIVDPLGLYLKAAVGIWLRNTSRGYRTYRVSRIEAVTLLDKPCERPANFDLATHWQQAAQQFIDGRPL